MDQTGKIKYLLAMLERLSADSPWAHQASGLRGALIRQLEAQERGNPNKADDANRLDNLMEAGYQILELAAKASLSKHA
jgi:hypothetical protein